MTPKDYSDLAERAWELNRANSDKIARDLCARHRLPPAAPMMIENLAALLAELQKSSFVLGFVAALYAMEKAGMVDDLEHPEPEVRNARTPDEPEGNH